MIKVMGQGQRSCGLRSKVKWVKPSLKVMILAVGLVSMSGCFTYNNYTGHERDDCYIFGCEVEAKY